MYDFYKIFFFFKWRYLFKMDICILFQKNLILLKKIHSVKKFILQNKRIM